MKNNKTYIAIDLKSFYASVECAERKLDPMNTNLVVADIGRTEKTICLAVSPSLKSLGIPGRPRLFEVVQRVKEENIKRKAKAPNRRFTGESYLSGELAESPELSIAYITAPPRMALYIDYSTKIYNIYLKYVSAEDIHVYSIDEVFIDVTAYLDTYKMTAHELTVTIIRDVLKATGITATAGIGENLYLCKVAMDIVAKKIPADKDGVRIAELDEMSYRKLLWEHRPLTDFWRVGRGYAKKLEENGLFTMGDVARCSIGKPEEFHNEELLYRLFGINAQLLIDHAWGWEPCTIAHIKAYKPSSNSIGSGQVLHRPYDNEGARLIVREMADLLSLDLVEKGLVTNQLVLTVGYDIENLTDKNIKSSYKGEITTARYGRKKPKSAHGSLNLSDYASSAKAITAAAEELFTSITDKTLLVRRITITANHVIAERDIPDKNKFFQLDLFTDYEALKKQKEKEKAALEREKRSQEAVIELKKKFGKNAVVKGMNLKEGATTMDRNNQIGGHKA